MIGFYAAGAMGQGDDPPVFEQLYDVLLYTGDGSSNRLLSTLDVSGGGVALIRGASSGQHTWISASSGVSSVSYQHSGVSANTPGYVSFGSGGVTLAPGGAGSANVNASGENYVCYVFKRHPRMCDVVFYTGTGTNNTHAHSVSGTPGAMFGGRISSNLAKFWWHQAIGGGHYFPANSTAAETASATHFNSTAPNNSQFYVGTATATNESGSGYVMILFAHDTSGDSSVYCGSYVGSGSSGNNVTSLGFQPFGLIQRRYASTSSTRIVDQERSPGFTGNEAVTNIEGTNATASGINYLSLVPGGFSIESTNAGWNASAGTYCYLAMRKSL